MLAKSVAACKCYQEWQHTFREKVTELKKNHWRKFLAECKDHPILKAYKYTKPTSSGNIAPLLNDENVLTSNKEEQAELLLGRAKSTPLNYCIHVQASMEIHAPSASREGRGWRLGSRPGAFRRPGASPVRREAIPTAGASPARREAIPTSWSCSRARISINALVAGVDGDPRPFWASNSLKRKNFSHTDLDPHSKRSACTSNSIDRRSKPDSAQPLELLLDIQPSRTNNVNCVPSQNCLTKSLSKRITESNLINRITLPSQDLNLVV
ncbi:hypothetical protein PSTG_08518 [Puccinia striiformis f. sp. tritici PST-78]|uniref:Uncharacterized protein n=1 Tax=Puccinia striiformis f. sp. tritici PST-78 TaxID=1165861 RepID=A0A0L0VG27_9BASI|nr:hypothetical protein PSTG_08518 [Puccinia striiformis f. sp. tritici PST-78]